MLSADSAAPAVGADWAVTYINSDHVVLDTKS
jgi:hypothetical protein